MGKKKGIPGLSFSWKRALGVSNAKSKVSRSIGIPLTRSSRQRKAGAAMGCCFPVVVLVGIAGMMGLGLSRTVLAQDAADPPCDWQVVRKTSQMTDIETCLITSPGAKIALTANKDGITFETSSVYWNGRDALMVRIDDAAPVHLTSRNRSTSSFEDGARIAVRQILRGHRIRTQYHDYPQNKAGEAAICTLPQTLSDCGAPMDRIMDDRSQAEMVKDAMRR